jgi:hypothetical protein
VCVYGSVCVGGCVFVCVYVSVRVRAQTDVHIF